MDFRELQGEDMEAVGMFFEGIPVYMPDGLCATMMPHTVSGQVPQGTSRFYIPDGLYRATSRQLGVVVEFLNSHPSLHVDGRLPHCRSEHFPGLDANST